MAPMIAYCGLDCSACTAYIATQAGDLDAQERLLAQWRVQFHEPDMPLAAVVCDGCSPAAARQGGYCFACPVRACALGRGLETCGHCPDYGCETMEELIAGSTEMRSNLEAIRRTPAS